MGNNHNLKGNTEKPPGFQISAKPILEGDEPSSEIAGKYASASGDHTARGEIGELPRSYGENVIFLVAQEPLRLFTYWDLDIGSHPGGPAVIRCIQSASGKLELEFEVPFEIRNWYIPVGQSGISYFVEIGFYRNGEWNLLGRSQQATTPRSQVSSDENFSFATLPLDTAFSALLASLPPQVRNHPDLMRHLANIQRAQSGVAVSRASVPSINEEAFRLLKSILGDQLMLNMLAASQDSASLSSAIHARLSEMLSSESSSEMLARFQALSGESSLFSGVVKFESLSSETLSSWTESLLSWTYAARHAAASEWLTSWGVAAAGAESSGIGAASSWFEIFASSWAQAAESASSSGSLSSWNLTENQAALTSWFQAALSSWATAAQSSWTGAELSSWSGSESSSWSEARLSSWFSESMTSWTAESLSSWTKQLLSNWENSESGSWSAAASGSAREFYMHVNAELIFYGGTHPDAKVTIDGKPVELGKDGTFHYHFVFPDGTYDIPIVAVSPDGIETRKAILHFERSTAREGKVDSTGQPPLAAPMGKK